MARHQSENNIFLCILATLGDLIQVLIALLDSTFNLFLLMFYMKNKIKIQLKKMVQSGGLKNLDIQKKSPQKNLKNGAGNE